MSTGTIGQSSSSYDTHTVYSEIHYAPCFVEDESGQIHLKLEGAAVEGTTTFDTTERTGGEVLSLALSIADAHGHERRHVEKILPFDLPVYVLGEFHADGSIGKPGALSKNSNVIVSLKSEEERGRKLRRPPNGF
ncbi:MAG: GIDE domain-containing protein [Beijerinckiaceae bacterium]|nr:GIDE domain-containing protein [Beijerinckiaceae bacterium]